MTKTDDRWIVIPNWEKFQHPDVIRAAKKGHALPWIRCYTNLLDDANYVRLSFRLRGLLHCIWLLYATHRMQLPDSPSYIARQLGMATEHELRGARDRGEVRRERGESVVRERRDSHLDVVEDTVRRRDLERLEKAGFLILGASKPLADASTVASLEERRKNPYVSKGSNRSEGGAPPAAKAAAPRRNDDGDPYHCPICDEGFCRLEMSPTGEWGEQFTLEAHLIDAHNLEGDEAIDAALAKGSA